jgi:hypothetical protein
VSHVRDVTRVLVCGRVCVASPQLGGIVGVALSLFFAAVSDDHRVTALITCGGCAALTLCGIVGHVASARGHANVPVYALCVCVCVEVAGAVLLMQRSDAWFRVTVVATVAAVQAVPLALALALHAAVQRIRRAGPPQTPSPRMLTAKPSPPAAVKMSLRRVKDARRSEALRWLALHQHRQPLVVVAAVAALLFAAACLVVCVLYSVGFSPYQQRSWLVGTAVALASHALLLQPAVELCLTLVQFLYDARTLRGL